MTCPHCGRSADFKGYRAQTPQSLLGPVRLRRAYYYCGRCGKGLVPWDDTVGLGPHRLTPGAERAACLLGVVCNSFAEAADRVLPEACGLRLDEETVRRATEDAGSRLGELFGAGHTLGDNAPWKWHKDAVCLTSPPSTTLCPRSPRPRRAFPRRATSRCRRRRPRPRPCPERFRHRRRRG